MPDLVIEQLGRAQIRLAYPLMQLADPALSLTRWLRYARRVARQPPTAGDGMLVARLGDTPHPCGAVCYRRERHMRHGAVLTAEHFVAIDPPQPDRVLAALAAELEAVALRLNCAAIRSILCGGGIALLDRLRREGHVREGVMLIKPLAEA